jgi:hypothetical protein
MLAEQPYASTHTLPFGVRLMSEIDSISLGLSDLTYNGLR